MPASDSQPFSHRPDPASHSNEPRQQPINESPSPTVTWEQLAGGHRLVVIRFKDQLYQLRETRNGKLILTK